MFSYQKTRDVTLNPKLGQVGGAAVRPVVQIQWKLFRCRKFT